MKHIQHFFLCYFLFITPALAVSMQKKLPKEFSPVLETTATIVKNNYPLYLTVMSKESGIAKDKLADMITRKSFLPEDVVLATGLGRAINSRTDLLLRHYGSHRSVGWMIMATMKNVKKNSKAYRQWIKELAVLDKKLQSAIEQTKGKNAKEKEAKKVEKKEIKKAEPKAEKKPN